jgi:triacylglycerol esterase/lipase EstA (alpha/beta hydrolase family)
VKHHVLLVPGFFGFANFGDFAYFGHVRDGLAARLRARGVDGEITVVRIDPTASLRRRAARVLEALAAALDRADGVAHLVGHSSGGLDIRLLVAPDVALDAAIPVEPYARRVRSVVTLSSPHRGTPLAGVLNSIIGPQVLRLMSLVTIYTLRTGRVPMAAVFHLVRILSVERLVLADGTLLNNLFRDLLSDFSHDKRVALERFFVEVGHDQALLSQLTPRGMEAFNATTFDRPGVRYGSVVTCARRPGLPAVWGAGLSPFRQATLALFVAFQRISARMPPGRTPTLTAAQTAALQRAFDGVPRPGDNDGMVPTTSQIWGQIVHGAWGDHLDVLGHFYLPAHVPPHYDWLNSGAGFTLDGFERMWDDVARFLLE